MFNNHNYKLLISAVGFTIAYLLVFDSKIALIGDNAVYYLLGKALSEGKGFVNLNDANLSPHNFYPPGYPLFIALLNKIFGNSFVLIKAGNGVLMFASLVVCYKMLEIVSPKIALFTSLLLAINSHMLQYSTLMMSEMMFVFFSLLAIYFSIKLDWHKPKIGLFITAVILISVSFYIRSAGMVLIIWFACIIAVNKKWKYLAYYFVAILLLIAPWYLMKSSSSGYVGQFLMLNPYQPELGTIEFIDFFNRIVSNFQRYLTYEIPNVLLPIIKVDYALTPSILNWALGILIFGIIMIGYVRVKKFGIYLFLTFGILLSWPQVWVGPRFLLPILPFLILYFFEGLNFIGQKYKILKDSSIAFVFIALLQLYPMYKLHKKSKADYSPSTANYLAIAEWLKSEKSGNVACSKPNLFYIFSNQFSSRYLYSTNELAVLEQLRVNNIKYVVLDMFFINSQRYLYPVIKNNPHHFKEIKRLSLPETILFEFVP